MDMEHSVAAWTGFGIAITTMVTVVVKTIMDSLEKSRAAKIAADKEIALSTATLQNEKEKAELKTQVAVLSIKTKQCEEDHKEAKVELTACKEAHADALVDRSKMWSEMRVVKDAAAEAKQLANGLSEKIATSNLAQGTAEGTAVGLAAGITQGIAEGKATEKASHPS